LTDASTSLTLSTTCPTLLILAMVLSSLSEVVKPFPPSHVT
jgi:hypothetical protein